LDSTDIAFEWKVEWQNIVGAGAVHEACRHSGLGEVEILHEGASVEKLIGPSSPESRLSHSNNIVKPPVCVI